MCVLLQAKHAEDLSYSEKQALSTLWGNGNSNSISGTQPGGPVQLCQPDWVARCVHADQRNRHSLVATSNKVFNATPLLCVVRYM